MMKSIKYPSKQVHAQVNNKKNRKRCEIYFKLTRKTSDVDVVLVSLLLTLNIFDTFSRASILDFKHIFVCEITLRPLIIK